MVAAVVVAWTAWTWVARVAPRVERRWLVPLSIGALTVLAVANSVSAVRAKPPREDESTRLRALLPSVVANLPAGDGEVIVRGSSFSSTFYSSGLVLALERRHVAVRVDPSVEVAFLEHRVHRRGKVRQVLTVATNDRFDEFAARSDLRLVGYSGRTSPRDRARLAQRASALDRAHGAGEIDDFTFYTKRVDISEATRPAGRGCVRAAPRLDRLTGPNRPATLPAMQPAGRAAPPMR